MRIFGPVVDFFLGEIFLKILDANLFSWTSGNCISDVVFPKSSENIFYPVPHVKLAAFWKSARV